MTGTGDGVVTPTREGVIEATTLWGEPIATYAPSGLPPIVCHSD